MFQTYMTFTKATYGSETYNAFVRWNLYIFYINRFWKILIQFYLDIEDGKNDDKISRNYFVESRLYENRGV
jgi:hypothetical protein